MVRDSAIGILRIQQVGTTVQTSAPPSESIIPPRIADNIDIPHINLSAYGYEPDSLGSSGMRSPPARAQETSIIPQLDGPSSLPTVNPAQERMGRPPNQMEQDPSQKGTYAQKTAVSKRRKYPEEGGNGDEYRRPHQGQGPINKEQAYKMFATRGYPGGGPPDGGGPPGPPGGQGSPGPQGPAGSVRQIIVQMPQTNLDTTVLENTFDTVGQSMMQLGPRTKQTDNYKNTFNRDKLTYKLIQEPYTN